MEVRSSRRDGSALMAHTLDVSKLGEVFQAIEENQDLLNDWETTFIDNVQRWWYNGYKLTDNQLEKLEQIYQKVP